MASWASQTKPQNLNKPFSNQGAQNFIGFVGRYLGGGLLGWAKNAQNSTRKH